MRALRLRHRRRPAPGILTSPEGGAAVAALAHLAGAGALEPSEHVVVFLTGSALTYPALLPRLS